MSAKAFGNQSPNYYLSAALERPVYPGLIMRVFHTSLLFIPACASILVEISSIDRWVVLM